MSTYQLSKIRIHKQLHQIEENPVENTLVSVKNQRDIHFCFFNIEEPYKGGFYHGVLQLPENYPFSAPKFKFYTNNGRFQVGKYVCTTFTSYHQEAWSSAWSIRTILMAIMSFFLSDEGGYGTIEESKNKKEYLAQRSLDMNLMDEQFRQLFGQKLKKMGIKHRRLQQKDQIQVIELKQISISERLDEQITESKQIIDSALLVQDQIGGRNRGNNSNRVVILLYGVLLIIIGIIVLRNVF